jgi:hypothetical protein
LTDHVLRVKSLQEEASAESLKFMKPEESKSLIVIDREGGHTSVDYELWVKSFWEETIMERLILSKAKVPKWTRFIDLWWTRGT